MKKLSCRFWFRFSIIVVIFLFFASIPLLVLSPYPNFQKEVKSYDALKKPFRDSTVVFLPEEDLPWDADVTYSLHLDSRFYGAKPIGYVFGGTLLHKGYNVDYSFSCYPEKWAGPDNTPQYRGIPIYTDITPETVENPNRFSYVSFALEDYCYDFDADYDTTAVSAEEIPTLDAEIQEQLLSIAHEIIDKYLDNT